MNIYSKTPNVNNNFSAITNATLLSIAVSCAAFLIVLGISIFRHPRDSMEPPLHSAIPMQPLNAEPSAHAGTDSTQTPDAKLEESLTIIQEPTQSPAIAAFRQWADSGLASGFTVANQGKGMELAKARAIAMKELIQTDPAAALRQALPAEIRASLSPAIAAAIEQPVKKTGMCSIRIMCNHASDASHDDCEESPILLEDVVSWNAYFGAQQWRNHVGQTVEFEGVAVDGELAVHRITPHLPQK